MSTSTEFSPAALRELRKSRGLSQERLAQLLGVTFTTVNRWENGHAEPSTLAHLAIQMFRRGVTFELPEAERELIQRLRTDTSGAVMKEVRQLTRLTQEALASAVGVNAGTINRWENGHSQPSALGVRQIELLLLMLRSGTLVRSDPAVSNATLDEQLQGDDCGATIKELRCSIGMTQEQFGRACGVSYSAVGRWETGHAKPAKLTRRAILALVAKPKEEPASTERKDLWSAEKITALRLSLNWEPGSLARVLGVPTDEIERWERDASLPGKHARKVLDAVAAAKTDQSERMAQLNGSAGLLDRSPDIENDVPIGMRSSHHQSTVPGPGWKSS